MDLQTNLVETFAPLRDEVMGILLWGSHAANDATPRSDVDICVVAGPGKEPIDVLRLVWRTIDPNRLHLDIRVFEELPRFLQGRLLERHEVIIARDEPALYEYLYPFRKLWQDEAHRQRLTTEEARRLVHGT